MSMLLEWDKESFTIKIREEIKGIRAFKRIIDADNSNDKSRVIMQLSYLYFMHNPLSDYVDMYENENDRKAAVLEDMGMSESSINTRIFKMAEEYYVEHTRSKPLKIVRDNLSSIEDLRQFMKDFNFSDLDMDKRMTAAKQKADLISTLNSLAVTTEDALRKLRRDFDDTNPLLDDKRSVGDMIELSDDDIDSSFT